MNLPYFDYCRPANVSEAVAFLHADPEAKALAGGQTLIPTLKQRLIRPSAVVDLRDLPEMRGISVDDDAVTIGAMTRHAEAASNAGVRAAIPALSYLAGGIAHPQVRNMGTLGGSIANNDPAADYPAAVVGLGAEIETTKRKIAAADFFTGLFSTALEPDELVLRVRFPRPRRAGYCKIPSQASGYAITGCFIVDTGEEVRVAVNGAGPCVFRQMEFEAALRHEFTPEALIGLKQDAKALNRDIHASAAYRGHLVGIAARRALKQALLNTRMDRAA
jgi:aerobic carbon-monoxide dehydrogenase medium subunit